MKPTAQELASMFADKGLTPITGQFNVQCLDGKWALRFKDDDAMRCCAITAWAIGRDCPESCSDPVKCMVDAFTSETGIDGRAFWRGFDDFRSPVSPVNSYEDYMLGVEVGRLVFFLSGIVFGEDK